MYHRFTTLADRKKGVRNDEIAKLAREVAEGAAVASAEVAELAQARSGFGKLVR